MSDFTTRFVATPQAPVTIYYCKANLKTGNTVRILQQGRQVDTTGVRIHGTFVDARMDHGNSTGKPRKSGARCVLILSRGIVTPNPT